MWKVGAYDLFIDVPFWIQSDLEHFALLKSLANDKSPRFPSDCSTCMGTDYGYPQIFGCT